MPRGLNSDGTTRAMVLRRMSGGVHRPVSFSSWDDMRRISSPHKQGKKLEIPTEWKDIADKAWTYFETKAYVRAAIKFWIGLALADGVSIQSPDDAVQTSARDFAERIEVEEWLEKMLRQLLVKGDCIGYQGQDNESLDSFWVQVLNPSAVKVNYHDGTLEAATQIIKQENGDPLEESLDVGGLIHLRWEDSGYSDHGVSVVLPAFEALMDLEEERKTAHVIRKRHREPWPILQYGGEFGGQIVEPREKDVKAVTDAILRSTPETGLALPYWAQMTYLGPDKLVGSKKAEIEALILEVLVALGVPKALILGDGPNFATAQVSLQKVKIEVARIRRMAKKLLRWVFDAWKTSKGIAAELSFGVVENDPDVSIDEKRIFLEAYHAGLISRETLLEKLGLDPKTEAERLQSETKPGQDLSRSDSGQNGFSQPLKTEASLKAEARSLAREIDLMYFRAGIEMEPSLCADFHPDHPTTQANRVDEVVRDNTLVLRSALEQSLERIRDEIDRLEALSQRKNWQDLRLDALRETRANLAEIEEELSRQLQTGFIRRLDKDVQESIRESMEQARGLGLELPIAVVDQREGVAVAMLFNMMDHSALEILRTYRITLAGSLSADFIREVQSAVASGIMEGSSMQQVAEQIGLRVKDKEEFLSAGKRIYSSVEQRAMVIARTETLRAHNLGRLHTYKQMGASHVECLTSPGYCDLCATHHGVVYEIDKVPELPRHPNCRCIYAARIPEEEE